jgi:hypothetical protein
MLAKREAMVHLVLSRAHSIYAETLTDVQKPQLVKRSCLHHVKQDRTTAVPTNLPAPHEPPLIHLKDDCNIIADLPQPPTSDHDYLFRNLLNLCMVYEEPLPTFHSHKKNDELDKLGCLSHIRWRHIHKIHCVFPNETGQIVLGDKSLDATHYQSFYANFLEAIQGYDSEIEDVIYLPDANKTTDDFLLVMN